MGKGISAHPWIYGVAPLPHIPTQEYRAGAPSWLNKFSECGKLLESRRSMCQLSVFWGWASLTALATKHSPCWRDWMWADFSTAAIYVSVPDAALHWKPPCGADAARQWLDCSTLVLVTFSQMLCAQMWQDELSQKSYVEPDVYFISILYDDVLVKTIKMQRVVEV